MFQWVTRRILVLFAAVALAAVGKASAQSGPGGLYIGSVNDDAGSYEVGLYDQLTLTGVVPVTPQGTPRGTGPVYPTSIAVAGNGDLWVLSASTTWPYFFGTDLYLYKPDGTLLQSKTNLKYTSLAEGPDGLIYAADYVANSIVKFTGSDVNSAVPYLTLAPQTHTGSDVVPVSLVFAHGSSSAETLYVALSDGELISAPTSNLTQLTTLIPALPDGSLADASNLSILAADGQNRIYAAGASGNDYSLNKVRRYDPSNGSVTTLISQIPRPAQGMVVWNGTLLISGFGLQAYSLADGSLIGDVGSTAIGNFSAASALALVPVPPVPPPTITSVTYKVNVDANGNPTGTSQLDIIGAGFVATPGGSVNNAPAGTTLTVTFDPGAPTHLVFALSQKLLDGSHTVIVTNPDHKSASATFSTQAPRITSAIYTVNTDGTSKVDISGTGFAPGSTTKITNSNSGTVFSITPGSSTATHITLNVNQTLPAGIHNITETNPDNQSDTLPLTTLAAPIVKNPVTALTATNGAVHVVVTGHNFGTAGYDFTQSGSLVFIYAVDRQGNASPVDSTVVRPPTPPVNLDGTPNPGGPQQYIVALNGTAAGNFAAYDHYDAVVINADGQSSPLPADIQSRAARSRGRVTLIPNTQPFHVFTEDQTQYRIIYEVSEGIDLRTGDLVQEIETNVVGSAHASPSQVQVGQVSVVQDNNTSRVSVGGSNTAMIGLISQDGSGLISQDGSGLVSHDGGSLISQDGSGLISQDGSGLVSHDGGSIGPGGSRAITTGNAGVPTPVAALAAVVEGGPGLTGTLTIDGIVTPGPGSRSRSAVGRTTPQTTVPLSMMLTKHDEGAAHGSGSTELLVKSKDSSGNPIMVLEMRYTPGQPDQVIYLAPGASLTPTAGTPPPQVTNPTPILTSLSPTTVTPGSSSFILTVVGSLFSTGAVIRWNGQPLQTTVDSGTQLTAQVPASLVTTAGPAQVTVFNPTPGGGESGALTFRTGAPPITTFSVGLQMISAPEEFSGVPLSAALGTSDVRLAAWDSSSNQYALSPTAPSDTLHLGQGYWARFPQPANLYDLGQRADTSQPFPLHLRKGWNMIGDPFFTAVSLSSVTVKDSAGRQNTLMAANAAGVVSSTLYSYPAGATQYQVVSGAGASLQPYQGYWVYAFQDATLVVPAAR